MVRVFVPDLAQGERMLDEGTSRYLVRVHRFAPGDRFVAFDPDAALRAEGEVVAVRGRRALCRLSKPAAATNIPSFDVTLLQGLGKGDRFDRVVRDATALGARRVIAVETGRSVVRLGGDHAVGRLERWRSIAIEAARQSGRGDVPRIAGPLSLGEALDARGDGSDNGSGNERDHQLGATPDSAVVVALGLVLDPDGPASLAARLGDWAPERPLVLLVGPEGGLSPGELDQARAAGLLPTRFGSFVLRTETAATAVLGAVVSRFGAG